MFKQKFSIKTLNTILIKKEQVGDLIKHEDKLVLLGLLNDNGYLVTPHKLVEFLNSDITVETSKEILYAVKEIRGAYVKHNTIIGKFPLQDSNQFDRSLVSFINHISSIVPNIPTMLKADESLYQLKENGNVLYLDLDNSIDSHILDLFKTKIPLSNDNEIFVETLYNTNDSILSKIEPSKIILKEILARQIAYELLNGYDEISARSAIDVLRAIAIISDEPNGKLENNFKIKSISNPMRKTIVKTLDKVSNIDDIVSQKVLFKALFKLLHVHETRYKEYENIRKLAKELQTINNPKTSRTELHKIVKGIESEEGFDVILNNPSLFVRNLDAILRKHDSESVLELFKMSLKKRDVETKLLVQILEHFRNRDIDVNDRLFTVKGKSPVLINSPLVALDQSVIEKLELIIKEELKRQYSQSETYFKKSYIHPDLYKINIPRGLSSQDGIKTVARGSRYKLNVDGDTIRMFVHWKGYEDVDLSSAVLDSNYKTLDTINFRKLSGSFFEHSGDVRSAEDGGTEYIDIYKNKLSKDVKYIAMAINTYSGETYDSIDELFGGFMIRKDNLAGNKFEPKTVEEKFSINGGSEFKIAVLFDVETNEVIMINSAKESGSGSSIENFDFDSLISSIMKHKYVTVGELLELHSEYVLCEGEQLVMSKEFMNDVVIFDADYGFNVIDITSNLL